MIALQHGSDQSVEIRSGLGQCFDEFVREFKQVPLFDAAVLVKGTALGNTQFLGNHIQCNGIRNIAEA